MSGTKIDPLEPVAIHQASAGQTKTFELQTREAHVLRLDDAVFMPEGAVLLPDVRELGARITGLGGLQALLEFADANSGFQHVFVGYVRRPVGPWLAAERARGLALLLQGQREDWSAWAEKVGRTEEYQHFFKWIANRFSWACDPIWVDNIHGRRTEGALQAFRRLYNKDFRKNLRVEGPMDSETWGAIYDVCVKGVALRMEVQAEDVASTQSQITLVHEEADAVTCGRDCRTPALQCVSLWARNQPSVDVLIYDPADAPPLSDLDQERWTETLYNRRAYWYSEIEIPLLDCPLDLKTVDETETVAPGVELVLEPQAGDRLTVTTDSDGLWSGEIKALGLIRVRRTDDGVIWLGNNGLSRPPEDPDKSDRSVWLSSCIDAEARESRNILVIGLEGYVWVRFLSPRNYPIGGVSCVLQGGGREWPEQKTTAAGEARWDHVPLFEFHVRLSLGDRTLEVPVPWLRAAEEIHVERLHDYEAEELLGPGDCPESIQVRLAGLGYPCGAIDGDIGPQTEAAIRAFQKDRGLTVDGIAGPATQSYLTQAFDGTEVETGAVEAIAELEADPPRPIPG